MLSGTRAAFIKGAKVLIAGAGPSGLALARLLPKMGADVTWIERETTPAIQDRGLLLPFNAIEAFKRLGLQEKIQPLLHPIKVFHCTEPSGKTLWSNTLAFSPDHNIQCHGMHRSALMELLHQDLKLEMERGVTVKTLLEGENEDDRMRVQLSGDRFTREDQYDIVIGADGLHSDIRALGFKAQPVVDHGFTTWSWIVPVDCATHTVTQMLGMGNGFHIYPISPNKVHCIAFQYDAQKQLSTLDPHQLLRDIFSGYAGEVPAVLEAIQPDTEITIGRLESLPKPVLHKGSLALVGDSAHGLPQLSQQGIASGLDDAICLSEMLGHHSLEHGLAGYQVFREPDLNTVHQLARHELRVLSEMARSVLDRNNGYDAIKRSGPPLVKSWQELQERNYPLGVKVAMTKTESRVAFRPH